MKRTTPELKPVPDGIHTVSLERTGIRDIFATAVPGATDDFGSLAAGLLTALRDLRAEVLELRVFAPGDETPACRRILREQIGTADWPVLFVGSDRCPSPGIAGLQARAVSGAKVESIHREGRPLGRLHQDEMARYCFISNLQPADPSQPRSNQVRDVLGLLEECLDQVGMDLHHVVRTWFFIDDILDWYTEFNAARAAVYAERGLFERYVPASTGIGHRGSGGQAVVAAALALEARSPDVGMAEVVSPLQCSARDYGSSFSRAAEIAAPGWRLLQVSGTASIDPEGRTVHPGDVDAQISRTLDVVGAILDSRGLGYTDVVRGNAYFRHARDCGALSPHLTRVGLPPSRVLVSKNAVCRDDLLFELEVDAVGAGGEARIVPGSTERVAGA